MNTPDIHLIRDRLIDCGVDPNRAATEAAVLAGELRTLYARLGERRLPTVSQFSAGGNGDTTLVIDFDGVIHAYSRGWADGTIYDDPVPGAAQGLRRLLDAGYRLTIFSARVEHGDASAVEAWCREKLGGEITDRLHFWTGHGKPIGVLYLDDRAVRFTTWSSALTKIDFLVTPPGKDPDHE